MNAIRMPWQVPFPKSWLTKNRLRYEVIGFINFSLNSNIFFHGLSLFAHDSDTTISILYWKIRSLRIDGQCGSKLQLHMDNCYRENKNKFVFAFCCMLVHMKWFEDICLFFLPPGHTHAENDAMFVPIGKGKWTTNCHSPPKFATEFIPHCYRRYRNAKQPDLQTIKYVYAFRDLFSPFIRNIQHHGSPRAFRFVMGNGNVEMFYKSSPLDTTWIGYLDNNGFQLMSSFPDSAPVPIRPRVLTNDELIDIPSMYPLMDQSSKIWWENFILDQSTIQPSNEEMGEFLDDFWTVATDEIVIEEIEQPIRIIPVAPIRILDHPIVADEILIGSLLALLPVAIDPISYWVATVTDIEDDDLFHIHYFECNDGIWKKMSKKSNGYCGTARLNDILAANFKLTKKGTMRRNVEKKIQKALDNI